MDIMETFDNAIELDVSCIICDEIMHMTHIPRKPLPVVCPNCKEAVMKVREDIKSYRQTPYAEDVSEECD